MNENKKRIDESKNMLYVLILRRAIRGTAKQRREAKDWAMGKNQTNKAEDER